MPKQISAYISSETQESMEYYSYKYGVKKGFIVENAIDYYLQALYSISEDFVIPAKIELKHKSFEKVVDMIENPPKPTKGLKDLVNNYGSN